MKFWRNLLSFWRSWKTQFFWVGHFDFFFNNFFFLLHFHENQSKVLGYQEWVEILMITLVFSQKSLPPTFQPPVYTLVFGLLSNLNQANSETFSFLYHVEPKNLPESPKLRARWSGPFSFFLAYVVKLFEYLNNIYYRLTFIFKALFPNKSPIFSTIFAL